MENIYHLSGTHEVQWKQNVLRRLPTVFVREFLFRSLPFTGTMNWYGFFMIFLVGYILAPLVIVA